MHCLVTGAAGFIGSHLCHALVTAGHSVIAVDAFTDNYSPFIKRENIRGLNDSPNFRLLEIDLSSADLASETAAVDWVFHLAARPGVRTSWGDDFAIYCTQNVLATQRLLESCIRWRPKRLIFASSSSVYGNARRLPVKESNPLKPISPYGATKLAGEHLCRIYRTNHKLPVCVLRYFTVYGPRQRPDMAFSRWITAILQDRPITIFGDGRQTRDFTFVSDAVRATILAAEKGAPGKTYNVAGGSQASPLDVLETLAGLSGKTPQIDWQPTQEGDPRHTWADTTRAREQLGFNPQVSLRDGLAAQLTACHANTSG